MRTAALLMIIVTAACGGGGRKPAATPEPDQVEGEIVGPDDRYGTEPNPRASQEVSTTTAPSTAASFDATANPVEAPQPAAKGCDAQLFLVEGKDKLAQNMPAQALAAFERAIVCVHDPMSEELAVTAACKAKLYSRAKAHLARVPAESRDHLVQLCNPPHE